MTARIDPQMQRAHRLRNILHSVLLLGGIWAVVTTSAVLILGWKGIIWTVAMVAILFIFAPRIPPATVMRMYRAQRVDYSASQQLGHIMRELSSRAELPAIPDLYVIPSRTLNAFATGTPKRAAIAITEGMLRRLGLREIIGVLAHEISHIRNNDLWIMSIADIMSRLTQLLSYTALFMAILNLFALATGEVYISWIAILLLYLAPAISSLLQLALSRAREYDADLEAALLTGDPTGLASALNRLERHAGHMWEDFMYPVPGRRIPHPSVLRSHPETKDRIERLLSLTIPEPSAPIVVAEGPMISLLGLGPNQLRPRHRWPGIWY